MKFHVLFALAVLCGVSLDLISKYAAFLYIPAGGSIPLLQGILHLTPAQNTGVAFSLFSGKTAFILIMSAIALGFLGWMYTTNWRSGPRLLLVSTGLIFSGAIGNIYDRAFYGHVRDFIDFVPEIPLVGHWPVFNVADIFITTGVLLFLFWEFALRPREAAGAETTHA
jgi:signal peptidase II